MFIVIKCKWVIKFVFILKKFILFIFDVCKCKDCVKVNFDCIFCYIDNMYVVLKVFSINFVIILYINVWCDGILLLLIFWNCCFME